MYRKYYSVNDMPKLAQTSKHNIKMSETEHCQQKTATVSNSQSSGLRSILPFDLKNDDIILLIIILVLLMDDCDDKLLLVALGFIFFNK